MHEFNLHVKNMTNRRTMNRTLLAPKPSSQAEFLGWLTKRQSLRLHQSSRGRARLRPQLATALEVRHAGLIQKTHIASPTVMRMRFTLLAPRHGHHDTTEINHHTTDYTDHRLDATTLVQVLPNTSQRTGGTEFTCSWHIRKHIRKDTLEARRPELTHTLVSAFLYKKLTLSRKNPNTRNASSVLI